MSTVAGVVGVPGSNASTIVYDRVGDTGSGTLSGTISGNAITLTSGTGVRYTGTISGNVMSGNSVGQDLYNGATQSGPFSLTKQ